MRSDSHTVGTEVRGRGLLAPGSARNLKRMGLNLGIRERRNELRLSAERCGSNAYSLVKAHMFNGINLPDIYSLTESGGLVLVKRFTYEDFASRCGVDSSAVV